MVVSRISIQKIMGIGLMSLLLIMALFFPYFQSVGLKWQLSIIPAAFLLFTSQPSITIKQLDLVLLALSVYCLLLFGFSGLPIHFNFSIGILIALFVSKTDIDETKTIAFFSALLCVHHIITEMLPSYDYTAQFNNLNEFYGANRSAFIFFLAYFFFYLQGSNWRFPFLILAALHSARFILISFMLLELVRRKNMLFLLILAIVGILIGLSFVDFWIIDHYFLNFGDASALNRLSQYLAGIEQLFDNLLLPSMEYTLAPHNFLLEIATYLGLPGMLFFVSLWLLNMEKFAMIALAIALMSPKTVHDLLAFYLLLGFIFKYANLPSKTILNIRFSLLPYRVSRLIVAGKGVAKEMGLEG